MCFYSAEIMKFASFLGLNFESEWSSPGRFTPKKDSQLLGRVKREGWGVAKKENETIMDPFSCTTYSKDKVYLWQWHIGIIKIIWSDLI